MTSPTAAAPSGGRGSRLFTLLGLVVGGICCVFVGITLANRWNEVRADLSDANPAWFALGLVLAAVAMTTMASGWTGVLAMLGSRARRSRVIAWYFAGELGKYIPGGVLAVVGRGELARRGGVPRSRAYVSVALSLVTLYLAAMFVATALLPFTLADGGSIGPEALFLLLLPVGLALLHPRVLGPLVRLGGKLAKRDLPVEVPPWRQAVLVVVSYVPAWAGVALATWTVTHAIDPDAGITRVAFAAVLSWIVGFLVFFVPGGVGVREAVFIAASGLDAGTATTASLAARILFILVDVGGFAVFSPFLRHRQPVDVTSSSDRSEVVVPESATP